MVISNKRAITMRSSSISNSNFTVKSKVNTTNRIRVMVSRVDTAMKVVRNITTINTNNTASNNHNKATLRQSSTVKLNNNPTINKPEANQATVVRPVQMVLKMVSAAF